jgi:hypothetical protein
MDSCASLHSQLYLVSYDTSKQRFTGVNQLFEFAMRAAMLTDLHLSGHLVDVDGYVQRASSSLPEDPVLRWALDRIGRKRPRWEQVILHSSGAVRVVRDQLGTDGHLGRRPHRLLGVIPSDRLTPTDDGAIGALAEWAREALLRAIAGLSCEPRFLATGLLAVHAQLNTVLTRSECLTLQAELRELTAATIAPISALPRAIATYHENMPGGGMTG